MLYNSYILMVHYNTYLLMKLVIKYEEEVRLFSLELHYHTLLAFIQAEFNLVSHII